MSRENLGLLLGLLGVIIFGGSLPATRLAVLELSPWFVTFGRASGSGLLALIVLLVLRRPLPARRHAFAMFIAALTLIGTFPALSAFALQTVPVAHGGVVLGLLPLGTVIASSLVNGERPSGFFWVCAVAGATVVMLFALRDGGGTFSLGDLYLFGSAVTVVFGYAYAGRLSKEMPGWEVICWLLVFCLPITLPLTWVSAPNDLSSIGTPQWLGFAYVTVFSQFLGFFAWNAGLAMGGIARVSQMQLFQTFVTIGNAAIFNHEPLEWLTIGAAVLVVAIVFIGRKAPIRQKQA
jgi:drug/metabolite transporter (DMT)-like permease